MKENIKIRLFNKNDEEKVREIAWDTAFLGKPFQLLDDKKLITDFLVSYYMKHEKDMLYVAESNDKIVGYLTVCRKPLKSKLIKFFIITPLFITKLICKGHIFNSTIINAIPIALKNFIKGKFSTPELKGFCSHLHINIANDFRGKGVGTHLISAMVENLKKNNVKRVFAITISEEAAKFFEKNNFSKLKHTALVDFEKIYGTKIWLNVMGLFVK